MSKFKLHTHWLEVIKSGEYPGKIPVTRALLEHNAEHLNRLARDESFSGVPYVLGHPDTNHPAYGWASEFKVSSNGESGNECGWSLFVRGKVHEALRKAIDAGFYKNISVAFNKATMLLRHIGFLGAVPPAVDGMQPIKFTPGEELETYKSEFAAQDGDQKQKGHAMGGFNFNYETDAWEYRNAKGEVVDAPEGVSAPAFKPEAPKPAQAAGTGDKDFSAGLADLEKTVATLKADKEKLAADVEAERERRKFDAAKAFVDTLVKDEKLTPAQAGGMAEFMAALPDDAEMSFADAEAKEVKTSPQAYFQALVSSFESHKLGAGPLVRSNGATSGSFASAGSFDEAATKYAKENKCSYTEAFAAVAK